MLVRVAIYLSCVWACTAELILGQGSFPCDTWSPKGTIPCRISAPTQQTTSSSDISMPILGLASLLIMFPIMRNVYRRFTSLSIKSRQYEDTKEHVQRLKNSQKYKRYTIGIGIKTEEEWMEEHQQIVEEMLQQQQPIFGPDLPRNNID